MIVIVPFFIILLACAFHRDSIRRKNRINHTTFSEHMAYPVILTIFLWVIATLRDLTVGTDIIGYSRVFGNLKYYSFAQIPTYHSKDLLFYYGAKLVSIVTDNVHVWLSLIAAAYLFPHMKLIQRYSKDYLLSFLIILALGFYQFSLSGLRQAVALGLVALSYFCIMERQPKRFIVLVLLASLFHTSAIVFLVAYPFSRLKMGIKQLGFIALAFMGLGIFRGAVNAAISIVTSFERFSGYAESTSTLNSSMVFIMLCIILFSGFYVLPKKDIPTQDQYMMNLLILGLGFQIYSSVIAEFFRIAYYFNISIILLIPNVLAQYESNYKIRHLEKVLIYAIFIAYFFNSTAGMLYSYKFFM